MGKRQPSLDAAQLGFSFDAPLPDVSEGALADMDRQVASAVSTMLRGDPRSRYEVAGQLSALIGTDVSKLMLDAYSSEARDGHNISLGRFLALVVVTQRFDALDALLRRIGCAAVVGEEILLAEMGHLEAQRRQIDQRLKSIKAVAQPVTRTPNVRGGAR